MSVAASRIAKTMRHAEQELTIDENLNEWMKCAKRTGRQFVAWSCDLRRRHRALHCYSQRGEIDTFGEFECLGHPFDRREHFGKRPLLRCSVRCRPTRFDGGFHTAALRHSGRRHFKKRENHVRTEEKPNSRSSTNMSHYYYSSHRPQYF